MLFHRHTVVQHRRRKQDFKVATLYPLNPVRIDPHAMNMGQVVGAITLVGRQILQQVSGKRLIRGKRFAGHLR
ncbi:hypothetical protein D3C78_1358490 [compost metagenome]